MFGPKTEVKVDNNWLSSCVVSVVQNSDGLNDCEQVLSAQGMVTALCIDTCNGAIIAGVQNVIR